MGKRVFGICLGYYKNVVILKIVWRKKSSYYKFFMFFGSFIILNRILL